MPIQNPKARREYAQQYNRTNRETLTAKKAARRREQREFIVAAKMRPCADCNVQYPPWVMQFDHVRGSKRYNLSHLARNTASWETIHEELAKCDVVCANCHAQRTYVRSLGRSVGRNTDSNTVEEGSIPSRPATSSV